MKKIFLTLAAAVLLSASAIAQDDNRRQQRPRMDRTEMLKMRTEQTAKQYNLDETQTAKLLELNTKYADTMFRGMGQMGQVLYCHPRSAFHPAIPRSCAGGH